MHIEKNYPLEKQEPIEEVVGEVLPPIESKSLEQRIADAKKGVEFLRSLILLPASDFHDISIGTKKD